MIDLELLGANIRRMTRRTKLYRVLKRELLAKGYWKSKPRGRVGQALKDNWGVKG